MKPGRKLRSRADIPQRNAGPSLKLHDFEAREKFDDQGLALLYQEKTARGAKSDFNKLVKRDKASAASAGR